MSLLVLPRGPQATGLPESLAQSPDPTPATTGRVSGVRTTAPPNPERVKQKPSTTMTTTASRPETTTASQAQDTPITTTRAESTTGTTARTTRQRRMSAFLAFLTDDRRDLIAQQREALIRLQLR